MLGSVIVFVLLRRPALWALVVLSRVWLRRVHWMRRMGARVVRSGLPRRSSEAPSGNVAMLSVKAAGCGVAAILGVP